MLFKKFVRKGRWNHRIITFTHWNPAANMVWGEEIPTHTSKNVLIYGMWVPVDKVEWL